MSNLYGLISADKKQFKLIKKHCLGDCGKISFGGMVAADIGILMICCEVQCPYLDKQADEPVGESEMTGESVFLRTLKTHEQSDEELDLQAKMFHQRYLDS